MPAGQLEVAYSGVREGEFLLYCISEVEEGRYIVFTLKPHSLVEPLTEPNREAAIETARRFFYDSEPEQ